MKSKAPARRRRPVEEAVDLGHGVAPQGRDVAAREDGVVEADARASFFGEERLARARRAVQEHVADGILSKDIVYLRRGGDVAQPLLQRGLEHDAVERAARLGGRQEPPPARRPQRVSRAGPRPPHQRRAGGGAAVVAGDARARARAVDAERQRGRAMPTARAICSRRSQERPQPGAGRPEGHADGPEQRLACRSGPRRACAPGSGRSARALRARARRRLGPNPGLETTRSCSRSSAS